MHACAHTPALKEYDPQDTQQFVTKALVWMTVDVKVWCAALGTPLTCMETECCVRLVTTT